MSGFPINNTNIKKYVELYVNGRRNQLPQQLKGIPIGEWDVFHVTNMDNLFKNMTTFNEQLNWDVSNVTSMHNMFVGATNFNKPLNWNVSNVTNMAGMFYQTRSFNSPLTWNGGPWNV